jgi:hypothetical protein
MFTRRFKHAVALALLFFVISSPYIYSVVDSVVGSVVSATVPGLYQALKVAEGGSPTTYGLALHSVVFGLVAYFITSV